MSRVLLDRPFVCPLCSRKVRQLYPLTHYDVSVGHWRPVEACLACCGPAFDDNDSIGSQFRGRSIQR